MKYFKVFCFFFVFNVIKSQPIMAYYLPGSILENLTRIINDGNYFNNTIRNEFAVRVVNSGQMSSAGMQNVTLENNRKTMQISSTTPLNFIPNEPINRELRNSTRNTNSTCNSEKNSDLDIAQQSYNVGNMQLPNVSKPLEKEILVYDSNSKQLAKTFIINTSDMLTTLDQVRKKLKSQGLREEDRFVKKVENSFFSILNETDYTLNDIMIDNVIYLDFDSNNIKKHLKGLKKDANGQLVMTNYTVADFKRYPHIRTSNYSDFESNYTFDLKEMELLKLGISDELVNYAKIFSYSATQQNTNGNGQGTNHLPLNSYSIARYFVVKKDIEITNDDLIINSEFYAQMYRALSSGSLELSKAKKLLAVLQKYGWYVPLHYETGGFFYITDNKKVYNSQEAASNSLNLLNCFKLAAKLNSNDTVESERNCKEMSNAQNFKNIDGNMITSSSQTKFIPHSSIVDMYQHTLRDPKQWKIVKYKRLLPTLLLLHNYNNQILSLCMKLLSEFRTDLQKEIVDINLREYLLRLEQMLY